MKIVQRVAGFALMLALFTSIPALLAQEDEAINVVGSRLVISEILEPLVIASNLEPSINYNVAGTNSGFEDFCDGAADMMGASRPMSPAEEEVCRLNNVEFAEYLLGYDVPVVITHPDLTFVECLTTTNLNTLLAPSAASITNWNQTELENTEDLPLSVFLPADTSSLYNQIDDVVNGFALRGDANFPADITASVAETPGAIGITSLERVGEDANVNIVELNTSDLNTCVEPSLETVQSLEYNLASRLLLYVNQASMDAETVTPLLSYITSDQVLDAISEAGFTPLTEELIERNQAVLAGEAEDGRQFSRDVVSFEIPGSLFGTLNVGGSTNAATYVQSITNRFSQQYSGVTFDLAIAGEQNGTQNFCDGTGAVDILIASSENLPEEQAQRCEDNNVNVLSYPIGTRASVLVTNAESDFAQCLTTDQVITLLGAPATDELTNWSQLGDNFPDQELILVAPPPSVNNTADVLLLPEEGPVVPLRNDAAEENPDPLYRAAAVANVTGGLTFMTWVEYQAVLEGGNEGVQLVSIGEDCITPTEESLLDDTYPYTESAFINIDEAALAGAETGQALQSILWFMYSDENYQGIEDAGFIGVSPTDLQDIRDGLQDLYDDIVVAEPTAPTAPTVPGQPEFNPFTAPEPETTEGE
jgi:phosphate transport system substrate-binding protein